jgi:nitrogen fixation/metabolism regulation signal transduction histidine kinase
MIEQIESLSFIASEFSDFARMPDPKKERLELNEIIRDAIDLYKNIANIRISLENDTPEAHLIADRKQLFRVFTNLLNNSVEAIGDLKEGWIQINIKTLNDRHIVTITDNGSGIPDDQAGKIFQPNFTTKSGGMGLGLAIVKNIIVASGGEISFQSAPSRGTIFTLSFPDIKSTKNLN